MLDFKKRIGSDQDTVEREPVPGPILRGNAVPAQTLGPEGGAVDSASDSWTGAALTGSPNGSISCHRAAAAVLIPPLLCL